VVAVEAAGVESNRPIAKPTCLALNARELAAVVDDEVVSGVLTEWDGDRIPRVVEREHRRQCRAITDGLWMLHESRMSVASDDNITWSR